VRCVLSVLSVALALAGPALAAPPPLTANAANAAVFDSRQKGENRALLLKIQVLLDRARFSPGAIDGRPGDNLLNAIAAFEAAHDLTPDGQIDREFWAKLTEGSPPPVIVPYTIGEDDVKGPFARRIPRRLEDQAELERLAYRNPLELLAEKFHMDPDLLRELNPGKDFDRAGETILVAGVRQPIARGDKAEAVKRIEVAKGDHLVRAFGENDVLLAVYPASIGSDEKPAPSGTLVIKGIAKNPVYTYNPDYAFKGVKAKRKFSIRPGPNNPVGTVWIDLSEDSYGIHGTPEPEKVGKTASHGCIRLTNWDAEDLAATVKKGVPVVFLD
jgi:lipoprotein-anchoring transpeptidase ErfK/SrfK